MAVPVVTAAQAAARDAAAIAAGTPSRDLMSRAGAAATDALLRHTGATLPNGVAVYAGPGNNGGDAWVVAGRLRRAGIAVRVHASAPPATDDARAACDEATAGVPFDVPRGDESAVVDGLLGTGATGAPRGAAAESLARIAAARAAGAFVLALDVPSGLDASTGEASGAVVPADVSVTFGTMKRGLLVARQCAGAIDVADIGLGAHAYLDDGAPTLLDAAAVRATIPRIDADAHKGTRGRVAIVGGAAGMAGAAILAARGALRSGAGLVRVCAAPDSVSAVHAAVPEAIGAAWPASPGHVAAALTDADAIVIGPGLGAGGLNLVLRVLAGYDGGVILDADGLNAFAAAPDGLTRLRAALGTREAILTPHPAECGRLLGRATSEILAARFDAGAELARATGAVVVLKGTPTMVSAPDGRVVAAPVGSPVLATGGSGDVLAGVAGALLAVMRDAWSTALAAVWAHGAAAETVATSRVRGHTLDDVVTALRDVWHGPDAVLPSGILAQLPAVGER